MNQSPTNPPPTALVEESPRNRWAWILPLFAIGLAGWLLMQARMGTGLAVTVWATDGHGIADGDAVQFHGIQVGVVEKARLSTGLGEVVLDVRLKPFAAGLAREGTGFWIARPHVAIENVVGLDTLFGARYVAVIAGPPGAAPKRSFQALSEPPLLERFEADGLELVLQAPTRFGLAPGAPVQHRGVDVGSVTSVDLAADGARVEVHAYVRPQYSGLVRTNTGFWETGGAELKVGLTSGFEFDVESLRSLLVGGVAFATPDEPGAAVTDGQRFVLKAQPDKNALNWRPALGVGRDLSAAEGARRGSARSLRMTWTEGRVFKSEREIQGWAVVIDGFLIGPSELLLPPESAREGSLLWFFDGQEMPLFGPPVRRRGELVAVALPEDIQKNFQGRELGNEVRFAEQPEACLVSGPGDVPPIALDPSRLEVRGESWRVDEQLAIGPEWNGALVHARSDGKLLGLLLVDKQAKISPLP